MLAGVLRAWWTTACCDPMRSSCLGVGEYELRWFIEVDRASESVPVVVRKCRLYADYYQSGKEQASSGGVFPRVCWIVPDETRADTTA